MTKTTPLQAKILKFKLSKRYYGPFQIIERIGVVAYKLLLPTDYRIHPVFHISLLKEYHGDTPINPTPVPESISLSENGKACLEKKQPGKILS